MAENILWGVRLYKFNNYHNRILKRYTSFIDYKNNGTILATIPNINFKYGDDVSTSLVLNIDVEADYLIVYKMSTPGTIESRWFIMNKQLLRGGQNAYTLRRDVLADKFYAVLQAPSMVQKAMLSENDSFILNREGQSMNQIKQSETLLKDYTGCPWIIGYIPKDAKLTNEIIYNMTVNSFVTPYTYANWEAFEYNEYVKGIGSSQYKMNQYGNLIQIYFNVHLTYGSIETRTTNMFCYDIDRKKIVEAITIPDGYNNPQIYGTPIYTKDGFSAPVTFEITTGKLEDIVDTIINALNNIDLKNNYYLLNKLNTTNELTQFEARIFKVNNVNYNMSLLNNGINNTLEPSTINTSIVNTLNGILNAITNWPSTKVGDFDYRCYKYNYKSNDYQLISTQLTNEIKFTLPDPNLRQHISNSGFDIFCMPYSDELSMEWVQGDIQITSSKDINLGIANALMTALGSTTIDLQVLPYCPVLGAYNEQYKYLDLDVLNTTSIKYQDNNVGVMIWLNSDSFTLYIDEVTSVPNTSRKIINECYMWRLCSPNYNSQWEYNIAKNNGEVYSYNVDVTLRPYNPYVHINPLFTGDLYGIDFNDKRGLILSGDFSLPLVTNQWANYTLQNKNYENAFNREIQSLELSNKWGLAGDIAGAITGTLSGTIGGAFGSGFLGLSGGTGAAIGGITSAIGGGLDVVGNQALRKDAIDKAKTLFQYNLQNIQAMPSSINKGTPLDFNNKLFPIIEEYKCTDEELEAFKNKMIYNGMTVNRIGTLREFTNNTINSELEGEYRYIELIPIRFVNMQFDYHMASEIASEMSQGFYYMKGEY